MVDCPYKVTDFLSEFTSNLYLPKIIKRAANKMRKFHSSVLLSAREKNCNKLKMLKSKVKNKVIDKLKTTKIFHKNNIVAYPDSDIYELYNIMTQLGISKIPVATNPWNKKLIGFINIKTLEKVLNDK